MTMSEAIGRPRSKRAAERTPGNTAILVYPTVMLGVLFLVPYGIMFAVSFFHRVPGGIYEPGFEIANYAHFLEPLFLRSLIVSLVVASMSAVICVSIGFPFTYFLVRLRRRWQVGIIIFLLCVLTLSEVILGFSWSVLLSRTAGLPSYLGSLGILDDPEAWYPGFGAVLVGLIYISFPYAVLMMYPTVSRMEDDIVEAALTLGASPVVTFFTVVVPTLRPTIVASVILVFVFTLGAYILPQMLGQPSEWTLSVLITDQAVYKTNIPFAAAMANFLIVACLLLIWLTVRFAKRQPGQAR